MGLRINQNISAMSAHRYMQANDANMSKSIERLSSGLRINSAADDAAGLVISETLRTQVSGLTQAYRNAQDGVNMFKTAEKALDEVENQLRNMRDLTLHAANSNGNTSLIAADQAQVAQSLDSIDRIASQTEYGGLKLFDTAANGNVADKWFQIGANQSQQAQFTLGTYDGVTLDGDLHVNNAAGLNLTSGSASGPSVTATSAAAAISGAENLSVAIHRANGDNYALSVALADTTTAANQIVAVNTALAAVSLGGGEDLGDYFEAVGTASDGTGAGAFTTIRAKAANTADQNAGAYITVQAAGATETGFASATPTTDYGDSGGIDLTAASTPAQFNAVIGKIDAALKMVNGLRVNMGAFQKNNLESSLSSIAVTKENLAASESAIRDTDMAQEMVNFTKNQILMQAGQAMLTQANQAPQNIMQMLRG